MLWLRYVLECERHSRGLKRSFVAYEDLLSDWRGCITHIANDLGLVWPKLQHRSAAQVEKMVSTRYQHHSSPPSDLKKHPYVSSLVRSASQALVEAVSGNRPDPQEELKKVAFQMEAADRLYAELLADKGLERDIERDAKAVARKQADEEKAARTAAEKALSEAHAATTEREQAYHSEMEWQIKMLTDAEAGLENAQAEMTDLTASLEIGFKEIATLTKLLRDAENLDAENLDAENQAANASLEQKLHAAKTERDKSLAQTSKLTQKVHQMSANSEKQKKKLQALCEERDSFENMGANLTEKIDLTNQEIMQLNNGCMEANDQLNRLQDRFHRYQASATKAIGRAVTMIAGLPTDRTPTQFELEIIYQRLEQARLFDHEYYGARYSDVVEAGIDPFTHYVTYGSAEGREPFDIEKMAENGEGQTETN